MSPPTLVFPERTKRARWDEIFFPGRLSLPDEAKPRKTIDSGFDSDRAVGKTSGSRETRFLVSSCCYVCLKFSLNVEHARVNKQPSHLHDCPSVTHCLPRQRYRARPRRIKVYPTVYLSTNLTSAGREGALGGAARERGTRERAPITYSANPTYILDTANLTSPPARAR